MIRADFRYSILTLSSKLSLSQDSPHFLPVVRLCDRNKSCRLVIKLQSRLQEFPQELKLRYPCSTSVTVSHVEGNASKNKIRGQTSRCCLWGIPLRFLLCNQFRNSRTSQLDCHTKYAPSSFPYPSDVETADAHAPIPNLCPLIPRDAQPLVSSFSSVGWDGWD
jgi:hypothetical protein